MMWFVLPLSTVRFQAQTHVFWSHWKWQALDQEAFAYKNKYFALSNDSNLLYFSQNYTVSIKLVETWLILIFVVCIDWGLITCYGMIKWDWVVCGNSVLFQYICEAQHNTNSPNLLTAIGLTIQSLSNMIIKWKITCSHTITPDLQCQFISFGCSQISIKWLFSVIFHDRDLQLTASFLYGFTFWKPAMKVANGDHMTAATLQ